MPLDTFPVRVNVYDLGLLSGSLNINQVLRPLGTGAFHCGIEVYWFEVSYGVNGIYYYLPKLATDHKYRESQWLGETFMHFGMFDRLVREMESEWTGESYSLVRKNCCHFCEALSRKLGVRGLPPWTSNLSAAGANVADAQASVTSSVSCLPPSPTKPFASARPTPVSFPRRSLFVDRPRFLLMADTIEDEQISGSPVCMPSIQQQNGRARSPLPHLRHDRRHEPRGPYHGDMVTVSAAPARLAHHDPLVTAPDFRGALAPGKRKSSRAPVSLRSAVR